MRILASAALALAMSASALAQPAPVTAPLAAIPAGQGSSLNPADAPSGRYNLDSRHVSVLWRVRHTGLSLFTARFDTVAGTLNWDGRAPANSSLNVTIDAASVNTGVLNQAGERAFDREIANAVLGAQAHPQITFVSRSIQQTGPATGLIAGDLTFNGVTRPIVLETTFEGGRFVALRSRHGLGFSGRTMIRRSEFNANLANPLANGAASDEVEIIVQVDFIRDQQ